MAEVTFWFSLALILYAYAGYPLTLFVLSHIRHRRVEKGPCTPPVSFIIAAHNEELRIRDKILNTLEQEDGVDWITALRSPTIQGLVKQGHIQLGLFDQRNLFEFSHPDRPGERLVACRNPDLAVL